MDEFSPADQRIGFAVEALVARDKELRQRVYDAWVHLATLGGPGVPIPATIEPDLRAIQKQFSAFEAPQLDNWIASLDAAALGHQARIVTRWYRAIGVARGS